MDNYRRNVEHELAAVIIVTLFFFVCGIGVVGSLFWFAFNYLSN